jgi:hypothetical protein
MVGVTFVGVGHTTYAQQPEPYQAIGTWKLNPAKSTGNSNQLKARSRIHTIENRGGGLAVNRIEQVNADGSTQAGYFTARADGTPYPMVNIRSNGPTQVGSMTETRVDAYTVIKDADGKVTAQGTRTVAKDGKSYRLGDLVYDKQ